MHKIDRHTQDRKSPHYKIWRRAVLKRDKHICQMPGCKKKNTLQVHHIMRYSDAPLMRYLISNGITLCYAHHKQVNKNECFYILLFTRIVQGKKK